MTILTLNKAGLIHTDPLFSNVDFTLNAGDRVGLIAGNGKGKTSLLRCVTGEGELTHGEITTARDLKMALVPQDTPAAWRGMTLYDLVLSAIAPDARDYESWRVDVVLDELEMPEETRQLPMSSLSGGWQRLGLIAHAWVAEPDLMLLDEPTNHLDLEKLLLLERWISQTARGTAMLIASHDRAFLDATTTRTLFLRPGSSPSFDLAYSKARAALEEVDAAARRQQENELKQANQLRKQAAKLTNIGINSGSDLLTVKAKQLKERASRIEDAQRDLHKDRNAAIQLSNSGTHARVLVALDDVHVKTPDGRALFRTGKQHIFLGDRIVLLGANGLGKSMFVRMLKKAIEGEEVENIRATPSIVSGYADQALSHIPDNETPMQFLTTRFRVGDARARSLLATAGFAIEFQTRKIGVLSWGQKSRLGLLGLRLAEPNFYLMDEPTNHIDIPGQEDLAREIIERGATCFLVSHDRQFVRDVGTRFWVIERGKLVEADDPEGFFASAA